MSPFMMCAPVFSGSYRDDNSPYSHHYTVVFLLDDELSTSRFSHIVHPRCSRSIIGGKFLVCCVMSTILQSVINILVPYAAKVFSSVIVCSLYIWVGYLQINAYVSPAINTCWYMLSSGINYSLLRKTYIILNSVVL